VPLCPPQISHGLTRDRTRASAVRGRRLTAWAMARPDPGSTVPVTNCEICVVGRITLRWILSKQVLCCIYLAWRWITWLEMLDQLSEDQVLEDWSVGLVLWRILRDVVL
jgi:hypothetical protein